VRCTVSKTSKYVLPFHCFLILPNLSCRYAYGGDQILVICLAVCFFMTHLTVATVGIWIAVNNGMGWMWQWLWSNLTYVHTFAWRAVEKQRKVLSDRRTGFWTLDLRNATQLSSFFHRNVRSTISCYFSIKRSYRKLYQQWMDPQGIQFHIQLIVRK